MTARSRIWGSGFACLFWGLSILPGAAEASGYAPVPSLPDATAGHLIHMHFDSGDEDFDALDVEIEAPATDQAPGVIWFFPSWGRPGSMLRFGGPR